MPYPTPCDAQMSPLSAGWAKVQEIRRHLAFFRESGKYTMVYMAQVREKLRVKLIQHPPYFMDEVCTL